MQCVAVCCSMLQYVAVCCSLTENFVRLKCRLWCLLQYGSVCCSVGCSVLQCVADLPDKEVFALLCVVAVCCSVLRCVAACCKVSEKFARLKCRWQHCNTLQHTATHCNILQQHTRAQPIREACASEVSCFWC